MRARYIVFIVYLFIGLCFVYVYKNEIAGGIVGLFGVLWFVFYPKYAKWNYKRNFKKHIEESYSNRINKPLEIVLDENSMNTKDFVSESKIDGAGLKKLIETQNHFFIKIATDLSLIVPKHSIENQVEFKNRVKELGAEYVDELNWTWE